MLIIQTLVISVGLYHKLRKEKFKIQDISFFFLVTKFTYNVNVLPLPTMKRVSYYNLCCWKLYLFKFLLFFGFYFTNVSSMEAEFKQWSVLKKWNDKKKLFLNKSLALRQKKI